MPDYRIRYEKRGALRYISHLDLMRTFERAFRRAELPVAFTEGFHPHPRVGLGPALPLGVESTAEYLDLSLTGDIDPMSLQSRLNQSLPPNLHVTQVKLIHIKAKPLTAVINRATYLYDEITGSEGLALEEIMQELWERNELWVNRRTKEKIEKKINIRPLWHGWKVEEGKDGLSIVVEFEISNNGSVRPDEFLNFLPETIYVGRVSRTGLWIQNDLGRFLPDDLVG
ncbi:MAG TPA: TIGR03936 family radical SAM-associated protein [Bacillota bacterium]|nr:TIGR03936 family radical SAM-associated protein [Bacillota bacterium]